MSIKTTHKNDSEKAAEDALKTMRKLSQGEDLTESEQKSINQATQQLQNKSSAVGKPMNRAQKRAAQKLAAKQARAGATTTGSGAQPNQGASGGTAAANPNPNRNQQGAAQRQQTLGLTEEEAQEMSESEVQDRLIQQLQSQGQGVFNKTLSNRNLEVIYEVYDAFETPDEDDDEWSSEEAAKQLIEKLAEKDIPAEITPNQHRRAKYGFNKDDNAQIVLAHFHGPAIAHSGDDKYILNDFFEELIVPKSAVPEAEEVVEEKKPKKSLFKRKKKD